MMSAGGVEELSPGLNATKSPNDANAYRLLRLANGLEVLLVASGDERKQKAACACSVQVGSFSDPRGRCEGLAHYCEHMLFLGSRKYPGEAEFEEFLSENGGYSNAYTECEYTCYYFEVNRKALHRAVDMFAQLFHQPLFTEDSSARELEAIESEFQKKKHSDGIRTETLIATLARSDHPWTLFGWGNLQSLRDEPAAKGVQLHAQLQSFFQEHYKPDRMRVCVFGVEPLDVLQQVVGQSFSPIPACPGVSQLDFEGCGLPFTPQQLPRIVRVRPIKEAHELTLMWQLPPYLAHYASKPESYLSSLMGDEGHGSILSFLKDEGLATELTAGSGSDNFSNSTNSMVFSVEVVLTEQGVQQWPLVASAVFQYLKMLRSYGPELPQWSYDEQRLVSQMSYTFLQEKDPCDLAQQLCERMLPLYRHRPEHLLVGPWLYESFDIPLIRSVLDRLSVEQCLVMILSSSYGRTSAAGPQSGDASDEEGEEEEETVKDVEVDEDEGAATKRQRTDGQSQGPGPRLDPLFDANAAIGDMRTEPRFGTEYWDCGLDQSLLREWEEAAPSVRLHVSEPNEFIATDFTILPKENHDTDEAPTFSRPSATEGFPVPTERLFPAPQQLEPVLDGKVLNVWHLNCAAQFSQPRSEVWLKITSPHYAFDTKNVRKEVLMSLYAWCLRDSLNETIYPASQARLHCSVHAASHGLSIMAGGFSQKLLKFIGRVLADLSLDGYCQRGLKRLDAQKEELLRSYKNSWLKATAHCAALRRLMLMPNSTRPAELERELGASSVAGLREFVKGFFAQTGCVILASGNTLRDELGAWAQECVAERLSLQKQPLVEHQVVRLEHGRTLVFLEQALDSNQRNSALEVYWQIPGRDGLQWNEARVRLRVTLDLLEEVMSEPLFDSLRTKQQLGYSVSCMTRDSHGVLGFSVTVSSAVKRAPVLLERVDDFLQEFEQKLKEFPQEKFATHITALGGRWLEPKRTLSEVQSACWEEVACCAQPVFDRTERDTAMLGTITLQELSAFYSQHFSRGAAARLVAAVAPTPVQASDGSLGPQLADEVRELCSAAGASEADIVRHERDLHARAKLYPPRSAEPTA